MITKTVPKFLKFYQDQISKKITHNKGASQINLNWIWIWKRFGRKTVKIDTKREYNCIRVISLSGDFACSVLVSAQKNECTVILKDTFVGHHAQSKYFRCSYVCVSEVNLTQIYFGAIWTDQLEEKCSLKTDTSITRNGLNYD